MAFDSVFDMTITVEGTPPAEGVVPPAHPAVVALDESITRVKAAADTAIWGLSDAELAEAVQRCEHLRAGLHSFELSLIREANERNLAPRCGAASTAAWLTGRFRIRPGQARSWVQLANSTAESDDVTDYAANVSGPRTGRELVETGRALAAGEISPEHAAVVDKVMSKVPRAIDAEQAADAEADLADYCRRFDPATVARLGDYMVELMREDTLDDEDGDRHRRRHLRLDDHVGGLSGQLTREGMAVLRSALDQLAAPNPAEDGTPDLRTPGQRLADALVELARRAVASDEFAANHGISHRVMVMIGLDALTGQTGSRSDECDGSDECGGADEPEARSPGAATGHCTPDPADGGPVGVGSSTAGTENTPGAGRVGDPHNTAGEHRTPTAAFEPGRYPRWAAPRTGAAPGQLEWGPLLSASTVRRLACHAGIQRIVLDPKGAVLDVGRDYRTATPAQFAALIARDRGCAFPGCTRPPAWCVAHHIIHWINGGRTSLDNLVLLCGFHHRVVHNNGWDVAISESDRLPTFYPPRWIDPDRRPRRNNRPGCVT